MDDTLKGLYEVIQSRKNNSREGSYTGYLFEQGLDKILKKVGEEASEVIIAAKSLEADSNAENKEDFNAEICDLIYHLLVLMAERDVDIEDVQAVLEKRRQKTGNLKDMKVVDKNS